MRRSHQGHDAAAAQSATPTVPTPPDTVADRLGRIHANAETATANSDSVFAAVGPLSQDMANEMIASGVDALETNSNQDGVPTVTVRVDHRAVRSSPQLVLDWDNYSVGHHGRDRMATSSLSKAPGDDPIQRKAGRLFLRTYPVLLKKLETAQGAIATEVESGLRVAATARPATSHSQTHL